jgi:hypothetical protein
MYLQKVWELYLRHDKYIVSTSQKTVQLTKSILRIFFTGALSNIPNFFDEIRANLHALQMDEDEQSLDDMDLQNDEEPYGFGSKVDTMSSPLRDILEAERAYPG